VEGVDKVKKYFIIYIFSLFILSQNLFILLYIYLLYIFIMYLLYIFFFFFFKKNLFALIWRIFGWTRGLRRWSETHFEVNARSAAGGGSGVAAGCR